MCNVKSIPQHVWPRAGEVAAISRAKEVVRDLEAEATVYKRNASLS